MNTIYRIVWNAVTGRWVVASELAKGRKKSGGKLRQLAAVSGVIGMLAAAPMAMAGPANGFSAGILGNASCVSTASTGSVLTDGSICDAGGGGAQAGIVSYTASGGWGAYLTISDTNTVRLGAGGSDKLQILNSGIKALATVDMGGNKITSLANGTAANDAVNFGQLQTVGTQATNTNRYFKSAGLNNGTDDAVNNGALAIGANSKSAQGDRYRDWPGRSGHRYLKSHQRRHGDWLCRTGDCRLQHGRRTGFRGNGYQQHVSGSVRTDDGFLQYRAWWSKSRAGRQFGCTGRAFAG